MSLSGGEPLEATPDGAAQVSTLVAGLMLAALFIGFAALSAFA